MEKYQTEEFFFKSTDYYSTNPGFMLLTSGFYYMQLVESLIYGCI